MQVSERDLTTPRTCETSTTVVSEAISSLILPADFSMNAASPAASTSSIRMISGSRRAATENPSRECMPFE